MSKRLKNMGAKSIVANALEIDIKKVSAKEYAQALRVAQFVDGVFEEEAYRYDIDLPVTHIYDDGSVSEIRVRSYADQEQHGKLDWLIVEEDDRDRNLLVSTRAQAETLAQALLVAAKMKWPTEQEKK